uniref:Uncharacterized protein n=1 Tax=Grammatophora oceanica TaxID=210454 RepID=A0A7S1UXH0_9STRA
MRVIAPASEGMILPKKKTRKIYRRTARGAIKSTIATVNEDEEAVEAPIPFDEVNFRPSRGFRPSDDGEETDDHDDHGSIPDDGSSVASSRYSLVSELTQSVAPSMIGGAPRPDFERIPSSIGMKSMRGIGENDEMSHGIQPASQLDDSGRSGFSSEAGRSSPLLMMGGVSSYGLSASPDARKKVIPDPEKGGRVSPLNMMGSSGHGTSSSRRASGSRQDNEPYSKSNSTPSMMIMAGSPSNKRQSLPRVQEEIVVSPDGNTELVRKSPSTSQRKSDSGVEKPSPGLADKPDSSFEYLPGTVQATRDELDEMEEQQQRLSHSQSVKKLQRQNRRLAFLLGVVVVAGAVAIALVLIFLLR